MPVPPEHHAAPPSSSPLSARDGRPVSVVHLVAELAPYARTGGLGEAVSSLAQHQAEVGLPVSIILPLYRQARTKVPDLVPASEPYELFVGFRREIARLWTTREAAPSKEGERRARPRPKVFFIENSYYFDRLAIYGEGSDYPDNARRFAFYVAAAIQALQRMAAAPMILHVHDWHTALAPAYLRTWYASHPYFRRVSTVLSVHNAGYQGHFPTDTIADVGLPWEVYDFSRFEWYGRANFLKGGMAYADAVTTVSPTHSVELRTPDGGFGLHDHFRSLGDRFTGIVNGIDQHIWDPTHDPHIATNYGPTSLEGKRACRVALQQQYGLPQRADVPIFGMSARLIRQKGLDLILSNTGFFDLDAQWIFLGAGDPGYEQALRRIEAQAPDRVRVDTSFNDPAEHRLMAAGDILLMPCQYEPCGLTQMRAQRYGTLPLVRATGGLADTVDDGLTGFVFVPYDTGAFIGCAIRALRAFNDRTGTWQRMMREAMSRDFGWARSEERYREVYRRVLRDAVA